MAAVKGAGLERRSLLPWILAWLLAGAWLGWVLTRFEPACASPDAHGYFLQARLLAEEGRTWFVPESPVQYVGVHWLLTPEGRFYSRYPPGFPLLLAAAWKVGGAPAAFLVNPLLGALTLVFLFLLCRPWIGSWPALLAAFLFACNPVAARHALHADAHTPAAAFLVGGLWLLDRWARRPSRAGGLAAGLVLGFLPTIRYAESLAAVGVGAFLLERILRERRIPRGLFLMAAGAALPAAGLLIRNAAAFGGFLKTGYSLTGEQAGFGLSYFLRHWHPYLESLLSRGAGPFLAFGSAGLAVTALRKETRPAALLLGGTILPVFLVYTAYYWGGGESALRFFLPVLPLFLLPGLRVFLDLPGRKAALSALAAASLLQVALTLPSARAALDREGAALAGAARVAGWLEVHAPRDALVVAGRRLQESLDVLGRWRAADSALLLGREGPPGGRRRRPRSGGEGRPDPRQEEKLRVRLAPYAGLGPEDRALAAAADLAAWAGEAPVFWLGREEEVRAFAGRTGGVVGYERAGRILLPPRPGFSRGLPGPARIRPGRKGIFPRRRPPLPGGAPARGRPGPSGGLEVFRLIFP